MPGDSGWARYRDSRGQLLFVAQQAAQALAAGRLEPLGLSPRAWGVLSTLAESGPLTQIELATTMSIDRTAMVYLIDELEAQTLAERVRSPQDRRAFLIHLIPGGRRAQRKAATALAGAADTLLTPLDAAERRHLADLLAKVAAHWQQASASQQIPGTSQTRPAPPAATHPEATARPSAPPHPSVPAAATPAATDARCVIGDHHSPAHTAADKVGGPANTTTANRFTEMGVLCYRERARDNRPDRTGRSLAWPFGACPGRAGSICGRTCLPGELPEGGDSGSWRA